VLSPQAQAKSKERELGRPVINRRVGASCKRDFARNVHAVSVAGQLWNKAGILDADFAPVIAITDRSRRTRPLSG
jgi:hypothetical protein